MAISYVSQVYESNPYVLPVDLNLLAQVNQYKQSVFYKNAANLKNQLAQIKNTDIANPMQRQRLNSAFNSVVNQIDQAGAIDYSDMGVVAQIEGLGSQIYDDPYIMSGIASTKQIRKLQGYWEKIKTDPKLTKYYAPQNEWFDNLAVNDYVTGGMDAQYNGSSTPSLYQGNPYKLLTEDLKRLKPNVSVRQDINTGNVYFIDKVSGTTLDSNRIFAELQGQLNPNIQRQIDMDAAYTMQTMNDDQIVNLYSTQYNERGQAMQQNIDRLNEQIATSADETVKTAYQQQILAQQTELSDYNKGFNPTAIRQSLATRQGRFGIQSQLYTNSLFKNAMQAYTYNELKQEIGYNTAQIHRDKMNLAYQRMSFQAQENALNRQNAQQLAAMRATGTRTRADGSVETSAGLLGTGTNLLTGEPSDNLTREEAEREQLNLQKVDEIIATSITDRGKMLEEFLLTNGGSEYKEYFERIGSYDGYPGISEFDLRNMDKVPNLKLSNAAQKYFENALNIFDSYARGDVSALDNSNFSKSDFMQVMRLRGQEEDNAKYYQNLKDEFTQYVATDNDLTPDEKQLYRNFLRNPSQYVDDAFNVIGTNPNTMQRILNTQDISKAPIFRPNTEQIQNVLSKLGHTTERSGVGGRRYVQYTPQQQDISRKENEFFSRIENRQSFGEVFIDGTKLSKNNSDIQAFLAQNAVDNSNKAIDLNEVDYTKINVRSIRREPPTSDQAQQNRPYRVTFSYKDGNDDKTAYKYITEQQAQAFGVSANPYYKEDLVLSKQGSLSPAYYNVNTSGTGAFGSDVFQTQITQSGGRIIINIWNGNEKIPIKYFVQNGQRNSFTNVAQAKAMIENLISNAEVNFGTRDNFVSELKKLSRL